MGFNPQRKHRSSWWDYLFVGAAFVVAAVLLAWAMFG